MRLISLAPEQQRRLERLARRAKRSPRTMLEFVLRDGFDACEEDVRENLHADAQFAAKKSVSHAEAMKRARRAIAAHGRRHRQAA
jgi:predicted transcriptional regulator